MSGSDIVQTALPVATAMPVLSGEVDCCEKLNLSNRVAAIEARLGSRGLNRVPLHLRAAAGLPTPGGGGGGGGGGGSKSAAPVRETEVERARRHGWMVGGRSKRRKSRRKRRKSRRKRRKSRRKRRKSRRKRRKSRR